MTETARRLLCIDLSRRVHARRALGRDHLPAHRSGGEGDADYRPRHGADCRRTGRATGRARLPVECIRARGSGRRGRWSRCRQRCWPIWKPRRFRIFAVQVQPNELRSRMQMTDVVNRRQMRHAHMVNISPEIMCQGMRADFDLVDRLSQKVLERARKPRASAPPPRREPTLRRR